MKSHRPPTCYIFIPFVRNAHKRAERAQLTRRGVAKEATTTSRLVRIRVTSAPDPHQFDEYDVRRYRVGEIYELPVHLAALLIIAGCAEELGDDAVPLSEAADFTRQRPTRHRKRS